MICHECQEIHIAKGNLCTVCRIALNKEKYAMNYPVGEGPPRRGSCFGRRAPTTKEDILFYFDEGIAVDDLCNYLSVEYLEAVEIICKHAKSAENRKDRKRRAGVCIHNGVDLSTDTPIDIQ